MAASSFSRSISRVSGSTSTKRGTASQRTMASAVAANVCATVITSSPGFTPTAHSASSRASVPLAQATTSRTPQYAANSASNSATSWPRTNSEAENTRSIAAESSGRSRSCCARRSASGMGRVVKTASAGWACVDKLPFILELTDPAQMPRRISHHDHVGWDVTGHHGSRPHQRAPADDDAGQEGGVGANLGKSADADPFESRLGMRAGRKSRVGNDHPRPQPAVVLQDRVLGDKALGMETHPVADNDREFHDRAASDRTVIADLGVLPDQHAVAGLEACANAGSRVDNRVRPNDPVRADGKAVLARLPAPGRRAKHAEVLHIRVRRDVDVRIRAKVWRV